MGPLWGYWKRWKRLLTAWRPRLSLRLERLESSMEDRLRALEELDSQCGDPGKGDNPTHDQHMTNTWPRQMRTIDTSLETLGLYESLLGYSIAESIGAICLRCLMLLNHHTLVAECRLNAESTSAMGGSYVYISSSWTFESIETSQDSWEAKLGRRWWDPVVSAIGGAVLQSPELKMIDQSGEVVDLGS